MSRLSRWQDLQGEALALGLDLRAEEGRTLTAWLWQELSSCPRENWRLALPAVLAHAQRVYGHFMDAFEACFLAEGAPGARWVASWLRRYYGFAPATAIDAVLERIRGRRLHLLRAFRQRHQADLFTLPDFRPAGLVGFFRNVARIEARHAPLEQLRAERPLPENTPGGWGLAEEEDEGPESGYAARARLLVGFWGRRDWFTEAMYLEGLCSLGLGSFTGVAVVERRCHEALAARLPEWERGREALDVRIALELRHLAEAELRLARTWLAEQRLAAEREEACIRGRLARLRERVQRHVEALKPKAREVREVLSGVVAQDLGSLRFRRVGREIDLLAARASRGLLALCDAADMVYPIACRARALLGERPANPRQHGLSAEVRRQRQASSSQWQTALLALANDVRDMLVSHCSPARAVGLADLLDYLELGVLDRQGITGGLRRPEWRVRNLLRHAD